MSGPEASDGIDLWRAYVSGELDPPPLHHLTGARPIAAEPGSITWTMPASTWLCSPTGFVEGGFLAYLADTAIATATATRTPAGTAAAPIDVTVKFLRPVPTDGGLLTTVGRVVNHGRSPSVAAPRSGTPAGSWSSPRSGRPSCCRADRSPGHPRATTAERSVRPPAGAVLGRPVTRSATDTASPAEARPGRARSSGSESRPVGPRMRG